MQLNEMLKRLMLVLFMLVIAACNSKKSNDKTDIENNLVDSNAVLSGERLARQQMQELQSDNIVYFAFDKYDIKPKYTQILDQHAAFMRDNPSVKITVEGHADERGTPEYNIALGERRANAVKIYLQSKGVDGEQIDIISYGKEKPAVLGHDEMVYAKNRRAVLRY